ncbi:glycosyltransferase family 2 protein [Chryseosolibacter indicus]|uniref:Glycosyltransferase n=1 Tax=Chryseosolibacter indicus TaxID=2782351 RepID=A0ABS5VV80_9BACT|nr:glycosyltransferase family 2 protein [Chryseosolibacter indicus]MBT1705343.1 glycosyltransferase [Chryseosolibacter indicus]
MKVSLITVSYNSAATIEDTIKSVVSQDYKDIEYIIVDGKSKDNTVNIIKSYDSNISKWISEPDKGIYDAMNKGLKMTSGEVVGMLNSDDYYFDNHIISKVADAFEDPSVDAVFGNLIVVDPDRLDKIVRLYSAKKWHPEKFAKGFMPPHPTFFVRRKYYEQFGLFKTDYKIASDYELLIRFLYVHKLKYKYLPFTMVVMRQGGVSSSGIKSNIILNKEIKRACLENGLKTNLPLIYMKYFTKVFELVGN